MKPFKDDAILLLVANPVDILTFFAQKYSGLPRTQVIGTGTFLDSSRLRGFLAKEAEVSASSIDAFVLGEHGESQFVGLSTDRCSLRADKFRLRGQLQPLQECQ